MGTKINFDTIQKLKSLGEQVLSSPAYVDSRLLLIEEYTALFDSWYRGADFSDISSDSPEGKTLIELDEIHKKVMQIVADFQKEAAVDLSSFHQKAKGIMKYVDVMPKRISIAKNRKG